MEVSEDKLHTPTLTLTIPPPPTLPAALSHERRTVGADSLSTVLLDSSVQTARVRMHTAHERMETAPAREPRERMCCESACDMC